MSTLPTPPIALRRIDREQTVFRFLDQYNILLGRDPICNIALTESSVSNFHAVISPSSEGWFLRHLRSMNGITIEQKKKPMQLPPGGQIILKIGMVIHIGPEVVFTVVTFDEAKEHLDSTETREVPVIPGGHEDDSLPAD